MEVESVTATAVGFDVGVAFQSHSAGHWPPAPPAPPPAAVLEYMNQTDLGGGDYKTTHMAPGTDPHKCAALCLTDPHCMVWVYVIRGVPAGAGDCILKNGLHTCPHHLTTCTAGRGHEPIGHKCHALPPKPPASSGGVAKVQPEAIPPSVKHC